MTNVPIPAELAQDLEVQAKKAGMSLAAYVAFLARVGLRKHDEEFRNAVRHVFSKYPETLRKLSQ